MIKFINKFQNFNIFKDVFRVPQLSVSMSGYNCRSFNNLIFFKKSSYFVFLNTLNKAKQLLNLMYVVRLFLKGVGYKILRPRGVSEKLVYRFELGFSVVRYVWLPQTAFFKHRRDRVIIFGPSKDNVVRNAKLISSLRIPDVYKGKGVRDAAYLFQPKPGKQRLLILCIYFMIKKLYAY